MQIKLFEGSLKKVEAAVNDFIVQPHIEVVKIKFKPSINGNYVMVIYEEVK